MFCTNKKSCVGWNTNRPRDQNVAYIAIATCFVIAFSGCSGSESHKQLPAANERIRDLESSIRERDEQIAKLKIEIESNKNGGKDALESLKKQHKEEVTALNEFHRKKLTELESRYADQTMEFGASEKLRIALQGLLDQPNRLEKIRDLNNGIERFIWFLLCFLCLGSAGWFATMNIVLREKKRDDLVRIIAKLGHQL